MAHPISDQTDVQMRAKADACFARMLQVLTVDGGEEPIQPASAAGGGGYDGLRFEPAGGDGGECGS